MTPQQRYLIALYTEGVIRARNEYRWHPFIVSCSRRHQCPARLYEPAKP